MWTPSDPERFTHKFKYVEFAKYVERAFPIRDKDAEDPKKIVGWKPGVIRDNEKHKAAVLYTWEEALERAAKYDNNGVYTSTFQYDGKVAEKAQSLSSLYFDIDNKDIAVSHEEARRLYLYLQEVIPEEALRIYFTGKKGFHIECEAIALGIGPLSDLADVFRFIANDLKDKLDLTSLDFQVYDPRRMWRIPNSRHQGTGLYKIHLSQKEMLGDVDTIISRADAPRHYQIPDQEFSPKANEWFREYTYEKAKPKYSPEEMMARFSKFGTGMVRDVGEMEFDPARLFTECHAMDRLWKKSEKEHHLEHEERLFLCSILTYSDQAIEYLHAILQNCTDYNRDKSESHIRDWIRRRELGIGGRPYSCARANSAGVGCGDCTLEAKEKYQVVGDRMVPTGELASPSPIRFAYHRKNNDGHNHKR